MCLFKTLTNQTVWTFSRLHRVRRRRRTWRTSVPRTRYAPSRPSTTSTWTDAPSRRRSAPPSTVVTSCGVHSVPNPWVTTIHFLCLMVCLHYRTPRLIARQLQMDCVGLCRGVHTQRWNTTQMPIGFCVLGISIRHGRLSPLLGQCTCITREFLHPSNVNDDNFFLSFRSGFNVNSWFCVQKCRWQNVDVDAKGNIKHTVEAVILRYCIV